MKNEEKEKWKQDSLILFQALEPNHKSCMKT